MASGGHGLGLLVCQLDELELDGVDLPGQIGRVDAADTGLDGLCLLLGEQAGGLDPQPRGPRLVVEACATPVGGGGVADGLLGRGEVVQP